MAKMLSCKDCGVEFEFSEEESEFYAKMGFADPIRCKMCRLKKKSKFGGGNDRQRLQTKFGDARIGSFRDNRSQS